MGWLADLGAVLSCALFAARPARGMDVSFDLVSYHYYYSWLFFHGGVAQVDPEPFANRYINPLAQFPWFLLDQALPPRPATAAIAAVAGLNLVLVRRITLRTVTLRSPWGATALSLAAMAVAGTGAIFSMELGMSLADVVVSIPMLAALLAVLAAVHAGSRRERAILFTLAGMLSGIAVGAKLTMTGYAVALGLGVVVACLFRRSAWPVVQHAVGAVAGVAVSAGWWFASVYQATGSPVFPYYNAVFKSPLWDQTNLRDTRFGARGIDDALRFPLYMFEGTSRLLDVPVRDVRWVVLAVLLLLAGLAVAVAAARRRLVPPHPAVLVFWTFFLVGGLLWTFQFGIARYAVTTELLTGTAFVLALRLLLRKPVVAAAVAVLLAAGMAPFDEGRFRHLPFASQRLQLFTPEPFQALGPGDVIIADNAFGPASWMLTEVDPRVVRHVVHPWFNDQPIDAKVRDQLATARRIHVLLSLDWPTSTRNRQALQRSYGLTVVGPCTTIRSNLGSKALCLATYTPPEGAA
ncbi:hypothetical protein GCM10027517_36440 [Phycicoccus ginsengisoli]